MLKLEFTYPDYETYSEHIGVIDNVNYLDALKFEQALRTCAACSNTLANMLTAKFYYLTKFMCNGVFDSEQFHSVVQKCGIPKKFYHSYKNKKGYSFDKEVRASIIEWIENENEITLDLVNVYTFLKIINTKASADAVLSSCKHGKSRNRIQSCELKGWNDVPLYEMHNLYTQQTTGRYYAREMPIVNLPLDIRRCITAPGNYFLMGMDLRQIDLSVGYDMYLRGWCQEYDNIFDAEPEDKYLALYKIVCLHSKDYADEEYYKQHRAEIKTNILAGMYMGQLATLNQGLYNNTLNTAIITYYASNTKYQDQVSRIEALYDLGMPFVITDAFGFEMTIEVDEVPKYGCSQVMKKDLNKITRDCISYITQSTSNSIKVKWLNEVMRRLNNAGCDEFEVWVCMDRHDEIVFCVNMAAIRFMPIFKDCEHIQIANWGTVRFKTAITLHYEDDGETWPNEMSILKDINAKIVESLKEFKPTLVEKEDSYSFKGIPPVHDIYIFSTSTPTQLYKELFNAEYVVLDIEDMEIEDYQQKCAKELSKIAGNTNRSSAYVEYPAVWDKYVICNSTTGARVTLNNINTLPAALEKLGIAYARVHTVHGDGFCTLGDCYGMKTSLNPAEVLGELTHGN